MLTSQPTLSVGTLNICCAEFVYGLLVALTWTMMSRSSMVDGRNKLQECLNLPTRVYNLRISAYLPANFISWYIKSLLCWVWIRTASCFDVDHDAQVLNGRRHCGVSILVVNIFVCFCYKNRNVKQVLVFKYGISTFNPRCFSGTMYIYLKWNTWGDTHWLMMYGDAQKVLFCHYWYNDGWVSV